MQSWQTFSALDWYGFSSLDWYGFIPGGAIISSDTIYRVVAQGYGTAAVVAYSVVRATVEVEPGGATVVAYAVVCDGQEPRQWYTQQPVPMARRQTVQGLAVPRAVASNVFIGEME